MTTEPTTGPGDAAVAHHRRSVYWHERAGAGRAMIAVATAIAAGSIGLIVAATWQAGAHSTLLPPDGRTFARDLAEPQPLSPPAPFTSSSSAPHTPVPSVTATAGPSSAPATAAAGPATSSPKPSTAPPSPTGRPVLSYEAEASGNVRSRGTDLRRVSAASGGYVVGDLGRGETLRFVVDAPSAGRYVLTVYYIAGERRGVTMSVNDGRAIGGILPSTGDWYTVGSVTVPVELVSGGNTIEFGNPRSPAPDIDRIVLR